MDFGIGGLVVSFVGIRKWFRLVTSDLTFLTAVLTFRLLGLEGYIQCASLPLQEMHKLIPVFQFAVLFSTKQSTPSRKSLFPAPLLGCRRFPNHTTKAQLTS